MVQALIYPLIFIIIAYVQAPQKEVNWQDKKLPDCYSSKQCYDLAYSSYNQTLTNKFLQNFKEGFKIDKINIKEFQSEQALLQELQTNEGQYRYGIVLNYNNYVHVYTPSKINSQQFSDSNIVQSPDTKLTTILMNSLGQNIDIDFKIVDTSSSAVRQMLMTSSIATTSQVIMIPGIFMCQLMAILKKGKTYTYMTVCGLQRSKMVLGIFISCLIQSLFTSLIQSIIFLATNALQTDWYTSLFMPFFALIPNLSYIFGFAFFCFSLFNSHRPIISVFTIIGFAPCWVIIIIQMVTMAQNILTDTKLIYQIVSLFVPGMLPTLFMQELGDCAYQNIFTGKKLSFTDYFNYDGVQFPMLYITILMSIVSLIMYTGLAILIDMKAPWLNHSIQTNFVQKQFQTQNDQYLIDIKDLTKVFRTKNQVNIGLAQINLQIPYDNSTICLLGPNGSGKTTLFNILMGIMKPTSGEVKVAGFNPQNYGYKYFRQLSVVLQENIIIDNFTVEQMLKLFANIMGENANKIQQICEEMGLLKQLQSNQKVQLLSGGQQKRLNVAISLLRTNPKLRLYDEATAGVDQESRKYLWHYLKKPSNSLTIITTHIVQEAEEISDKVIMLNSGVIIIYGEIEHVKRQLQSYIVIKYEPKDQNHLINILTSENIEYKHYDNNQITIKENDYHILDQILEIKSTKIIWPTIAQLFQVLSDKELLTELSKQVQLTQ